MNILKLNHPPLVKSLRKAHSAERAACFAYIGHAASLRDPAERAAIRQIELDEWEHRAEVLKIMDRYAIPVSRFNEWKYYLIGKLIGYSCFVIGRFMPYFFAGKLESGNVCEYFVMIQYFHALGITEHDAALCQMGIKEKAHEVHFQEVVKDAKWLPLFERVFNWGVDHSLNDVNLNDPFPVEEGHLYCRGYKGKSPEVLSDDNRTA
jgi:hypothetical protein